MWTTVVSGVELLTASRWTVAYFNHGEVQNASSHPMRPIGELAEERKGSVDPHQLGDAEINYLGLENVFSLTGELVAFAPRAAISVKSRSKIFRADDVLYGRLRPELNKVFLAEGRVTEGLCSGEFIVLTPKKNVILPRFFRHLLASRFVTQFAARLKVGTSLPRMGTEDLLAIELPVPPMNVQMQLVQQLEHIDGEIVRARQRLENLPTAAAEALLECIAIGQPHLKVA